MDKGIKDGTDMTIGVDLGDKWSGLRVLDEHGEICEEGRIASTAAAMRKRFSTEAPCRIVIEVGTHSPWVQRLLQELGHPCEYKEEDYRIKDVPARAAAGLT